MARKVETPEETDLRLKRATEEAEKQATLPGHVFINVTAGPYAGKRLQVAEADASSAVSEGWAQKLGEEPEDREELSPEEAHELANKANKAAKKLRGEKDEDKDDDKGERRGRRGEERQAKQVEADEDKGEYSTRDVRAKK